MVRELRYKIEVPGFRTREVTLVTTHRRRGVSRRCAGGTLWDEVAVEEHLRPETDDEDGR